jgi:hypothetical protein
VNEHERMLAPGARRCQDYWIGATGRGGDAAFVGTGCERRRRIRFCAPEGG